MRNSPAVSPTKGLDVAALRSLFRSSRDLKENSEVLTNSELLMDPVMIVAFCRDRFHQIRELVENTDSSRISVDFPRYLHRLRHLVTRIRHLFQFASLTSETRASVLAFQEELERFVGETAGELRMTDYSQPVYRSSPHG
jgi:hypothetical protein